jgi:hypothetical protein
LPLLKRLGDDVPDIAGERAVIALGCLLQPLPQLGINRDRDLFAPLLLRHLRPPFVTQRMAAHCISAQRTTMQSCDVRSAQFSGVFERTIFSLSPKPSGACVRLTVEPMENA